MSKNKSKKPTRRTPFAIRRKEARAGHRDPFYSPERDLAHIGVGFMTEVGRSFKDEFLEPWFKQFIEDNGITEDQMVDATARLMKAYNEVIQMADPVVALEKHGFTKLPPAIQVAFYTKMGQVALGGIWAGIKDVHKPTDSPPAEFEELLREVMEKTDQIAETLNADNESKSSAEVDSTDE
mgnify:CR=1 FL=1